MDSIGRDEFGEAVTHFVERGNAVALKRRLASRGETVHLERSIVHGLSEVEKARRFSDYFQVPEYNLPVDRGTKLEPSDYSQGAAVDAPGPDVPKPSRRQIAPQILDGESSWGRRSYDRKCEAAMQLLTRMVEAEGPAW